MNPNHLIQSRLRCSIGRLKVSSQTSALLCEVFRTQMSSTWHIVGAQRDQCCKIKLRAFTPLDQDTILR